MTLTTHRTTTALTTATLALTIGLSGCSDLEAAGNNSTETPGTVVDPTADGAPDPQGPDGSYIRQELREDPERLWELDGRMREEFPAFQGQEDNIGPMFLGMQLCAVLDADDRNGRDAQARYDEYLEEFSRQDFYHVETEQNWVEFSIEQICPHLEPTTN